MKRIQHPLILFDKIRQAEAFRFDVLIAETNEKL